jgi:hypothetical protein
VVVCLLMSTASASRVPTMRRSGSSVILPPHKLTLTCLQSSHNHSTLVHWHASVDPTPYNVFRIPQPQKFVFYRWFHRGDWRLLLPNIIVGWLQGPKRLLLVSFAHAVSTQGYLPPLDTLREAVLDQLEAGVGARRLPESIQVCLATHNCVLDQI